MFKWSYVLRAATIENGSICHQKSEINDYFKIQTKMLSLVTESGWQNKNKVQCYLIIIYRLVYTVPGNQQEGKLRHKVTYGVLHKVSYKVGAKKHSSSLLFFFFVTVKLSQITIRKSAWGTSNSVNSLFIWMLEFLPTPKTIF